MGTGWLTNFGATRDEDEDQRLLRKALVVATLLGIGLTVLVGLFATAVGPTVAYLNLGGAVVLAAWLGWFKVHRSVSRMAWGISLVLIAAPCLATFQMGSVVGNGGILVTAALGPLFAAVFLPRRSALFVFGLYFSSALSTSLLVAKTTPLRSSEREIDIAISEFANTALLSAFAVFLIAYLIQKRRQAMAALAAEHKRSEDLLLNILPSSIAARLKASPTIIADSFEQVTILFADLVGFTPLASKLQPARLVEILNDLFSRFDALCDRHGIEKIKTIGDAYFVVAGLPTPRPDHAQAVAKMALDMLDALAAFRADTGMSLDLRIGINSGPVVAGVIGRKKFIYDLWGDAVNLASRMESHGRPGAIHVAPATHALLQGEFSFQPCGQMAIKGKGDINTWLLTGILPSPTPVGPSPQPRNQPD